MDKIGYIKFKAKAKIPLLNMFLTAIFDISHGLKKVKLASEMPKLQSSLAIDYLSLTLLVESQATGSTLIFHSQRPTHL